MLIRQHRIGDVAISHSQAITQVDFSPAFLLATCGQDDRICIWDWSSQQLRHRMAGSLFAFSPDGTHLYAASRERRRVGGSSFGIDFTVANLVKYDVATGQKIAESEPAGIEVCALAVSPRGNLIAAARLTQPAVFHDAQTMKPLFCLIPPGEATVGSIHFLDENHVLTKGYTINDYDATAYLWDLRSRQPIRTLSGAKTSLSVSADLRWAAAGADEMGLVRVWDLRDGKVRHEFLYSENKWVMATAFFRHGPLVAVVGQGDSERGGGRLKVWNTDTGELVGDHQPAGEPRWLYDVCISPDDRWVVAGAADGRLRVWDWRSRNELASIRDQSGRIQSIVCLNRECLLTSGYQDRTIRRWNIKTGEALGIKRNFEEVVDQLVYCVSRRLLAASHANAVRLWRVRGGTISGSDSLLGEIAHPGVSNVCFTQDGKRLVTSGSDGTIRLWDLKTYTEVSRLQVHDDKSDCFIGRLALCPDDTAVVFTQMWSANVFLWAWGSRTVTARLKSGRRDLGPLAFSSDGRWLAAGGADSSKITVWSWPKRKIIHRLKAIGGHINALVFSPTEPHLLASADADGNVTVFDMQTGARIADDTIESGQAWSLAFSRDSRRLIAGSEFGVLGIWKMP